MSFFKAVLQGVVVVALLALAVVAVFKWGPIGIVVALVILVALGALAMSFGRGEQEERAVDDWHEA